MRLFRWLASAAIVSTLLLTPASAVRNAANIGGNPKKPFRFYDGPAKPKEEVAILKSPNFALHHRKFPLTVTIFLWEINGKPKPGPGWAKDFGYNSAMSRGFYIELPPGAYTLTVAYASSDWFGTSSGGRQTVAFTAEAGHEYVLGAKTAQREKGEKAYVDPHTGMVVVGTWYPTLDDETMGARIHP